VSYKETQFRLRVVFRYNSHRHTVKIDSVVPARTFGTTYTMTRVKRDRSPPLDR